MILKDYLYYQDDAGEIYCGDCLEIMPLLADKSIDLVLTDPPFFLPASHYQSRVHWQKHYGDLTPLKVFWGVMINEFVRILKKDGHLFVFCNCDSYPVFYEPTYNSFDKIKSLVWDKQKVGLGRVFRNQHELIIWARWQEHKFVQDGKLRSDVLSFPATQSHNREHPVEKPTTMLSELIEGTTNKKDIVLDPFAGSGTTCQASKQLNRRFIGIEISEKYCEIAKNRLQIKEAINGKG